MPFMENTSVAEDRYFIKEFMFVPNFGFNPYEDIIFSDIDKIFIDPKTRKIRLKRQVGTTKFPTDDNIYFRTDVSNPMAARAVEIIQVKSTEPRNTYTQIRLYNGTNEYYWDGAAWSIAGVGDWNDEATTNANLSTFPFLPDRKLAVVVNVKTDDANYTPEIKEVLALYKFKIDYIEDLIFRSLIPNMKANIKPVANYPLPAFDVDTDTITLSEYQLDVPFEIVDVEAVYDFTADSELLYNILDSYDPATTIITTTVDVPSGHTPFVIFRYAPKFVYTTDQDYIEVAKVPSIVLQRLEIPFVNEYTLLSKEIIIDKGTGRAVIIDEPWRATFEFRVHCYADKAVDEVRIMSALMDYFQNNRFMRLVGADECYRMIVIRELRDLNSPNNSGEKVFWTRFQIVDVKMPLKYTETVAREKLSLIFKGHEDSPSTDAHGIVLHSPELVGEAPKWLEVIDVEE